jgi:hypothetical protein
MELIKANKLSDSFLPSREKERMRVGIQAMVELFGKGVRWGSFHELKGSVVNNY